MFDRMVAWVTVGAMLGAGCLTALATWVPTFAVKGDAFHGWGLGLFITAMVLGVVTLYIMVAAIGGTSWLPGGSLRKRQLREEKRGKWLTGGEMAQKLFGE